MRRTLHCWTSSILKSFQSLTLTVHAFPLQHVANDTILTACATPCRALLIRSTHDNRGPLSAAVIPLRLLDRKTAQPAPIPHWRLHCSRQRHPSNHSIIIYLGRLATKPLTADTYRCSSTGPSPSPNLAGFVYLDNPFIQPLSRRPLNRATVRRRKGRAQQTGLFGALILEEPTTRTRGSVARHLERATPSHYASWLILRLRRHPPRCRLSARD